MNERCVVAVRDKIDPQLAGTGPREYTSPPQSRDQAMELVQLLLGCPAIPPAIDGSVRWVRPVAGGQRTITLTATTEP
jgi:hypothetical protein